MFVNVPSSGVAVATTDVLATFNTETAKIVGIQVRNTGANALDAFELWGKVSPSAAAVKFSGLAADFTTPVYPVIKASASPVTLAAAASVWIFVDVTGLSELQVRASSAVGVTTLEIFGSVKFLS